MSEVIQHKSNSTPAIKLTKSAEHRVLSYLDENKHKGLRLSVKKTGCSGLSYVLDIQMHLNNDYFVSIDKTSYPYVNGVTIDYVKKGLNQVFVFNNPNQTGQCGCGESFTVDPQE